MLSGILEKSHFACAIYLTQVNCLSCAFFYMFTGMLCDVCIKGIINRLAWVETQWKGEFMEKHNTKFAVTLFNILDFDETSKVDSGHLITQLLSLDFW